MFECITHTYALPIVLICHYAYYFLLAYVCQRVCSHTFVWFLDNLHSLFVFIVHILSESLVT